MLWVTRFFLAPFGLCATTVTALVAIISQVYPPAWQYIFVLDRFLIVTSLMYLVLMVKRSVEASASDP